MHFNLFIFFAFLFVFFCVCVCVPQKSVIIWIQMVEKKSNWYGMAFSRAFIIHFIYFNYLSPFLIINKTINRKNSLTHFFFVLPFFLSFIVFYIYSYLIWYNMYQFIMLLQFQILCNVIYCSIDVLFSVFLCVFLKITHSFFFRLLSKSCYTIKRINKQEGAGDSRENNWLNLKGIYKSYEIFKQPKYI